MYIQNRLANTSGPAISASSSVSEFYSGGTWFEYRRGQQQYSLKIFIVFLITSTEIPRERDHLLLHHFKPFTKHPSIRHYIP